ncbi:Hypothetical_protein [Hexamita inflata]|uniref:Hypothetical_protein n=1 Tax=Hexamita inflata TaxID=28002 RepID=A0AA86P558_9EUKA|nr:Hypothetical protein HINF_LOCUS19468 [Hexamita inflata]
MFTQLFITFFFKSISNYGNLNINPSYSVGVFKLITIFKLISVFKLIATFQLISVFNCLSVFSCPRVLKPDVIIFTLLYQIITLLYLVLFYLCKVILLKIVVVVNNVDCLFTLFSRLLLLLLRLQLRQSLTSTLGTESHKQNRVQMTNKLLISKVYS